MPRAATRLVRLSEACELLGCSRRTFWSRWHPLFTDPRPRGDRRKGCVRRVYEDELSIAVNDAARCPAALTNYRALMKRV